MAGWGLMVRDAALWLLTMRGWIRAVPDGLILRSRACAASRRMGGHNIKIRLSLPAARQRPSCAINTSLKQKRAQGKPDARCTRSLACK